MNFANLPSKGIEIHVKGNMPIYQEGGHLQGIQMYEEGHTKSVFMSGSSTQVSFMVHAEVDGQTRIISVDTLLSDPYRHAGGFQIYGQYLAIGIEDNKRRNTSRVLVYDLTREGNIWTDPLQIIQRDGDYERVTAGAVGMSRINGHYLIVVANWDSRNLDFYVCPEDRLNDGKYGFRQVASLDMKNVSRENWSDPDWNSYQNINLFVDSDNGLFLVGFAVNEEGENVADLFRLDMEADLFLRSNPSERKETEIFLTKLDSRIFESISKSSFRWGAGLHIDQEGELTLMACPEHMDEDACVVIFK